MSRYAVIMAGGPGTRLWPMSRKARPKQLLPFGPGGKSLLRLTVDRLAGCFDCNNIYVIAGTAQMPAIRTELPELSVKNLIGEPAARDTANAIALACAVIAQNDPDGTVCVFTADHIIEPVDHFQQAVEAAVTEIENRPESLGTFGIKPTWPHTGLGYIHRGRPLGGTNMPIFAVESFREKPDEKTARAYLASGRYYWNSGMFVWKAKTIMEQLETFLPGNVKLLLELAKFHTRSDWTDRAETVYDQLEKISIDYAVMEKAANVFVVELNCRWADVGSWHELAKVTGTDDAGNAVLAENIVTVDSSDNVLVADDPDHLIAAVGVTDLIVVHTADATLICSKDQAQKIKQMAAELDQTFAGKYT